MWWYRSLAVAVAAALLAGCGFRPLYGTGGNTEQELADIRVLPINDRNGQVLHNHLLDMLTPRGRPERPRYDLDIKLSERIDRLGVQKTELATRANLWMSAVFVLKSPGGENLFAGQSVAIASFNILGTEDLATLMSEKDARDRALRQIAEDMRARLGAFLAQRQPAPPGRAQ